MSAVRVRTIVSDDGILTIKVLPSMAGHTVDVLVQDQAASDKAGRYPLRGKPVRYEKPFEGVAEEDWSALR